VVEIDIFVILAHQPSIVIQLTIDIPFPLISQKTKTKYSSEKEDTHEKTQF